MSAGEGLGQERLDKDEIGPERTCIVTRRKASPDGMIRFVLGPDGSIVPDLRRKLPGRGVWLTAEAAVLARAVKAQAFSRGLKAKVRAGDTLVAEVDRLLEREAVQSLALANKAGLVTTGFAKVEAALAAGGVIGLLHATDGGDDGIRKLEAASRRGTSGEPMISLKLFTSQQLDLALGRTNVIHAALAEGPAGQAFLTRCRRLISYRATPPHLEANAKTAFV